MKQLNCLTSIRHSMIMKEDIFPTQISYLQATATAAALLGPFWLYIPNFYL